MQSILLGFKVAILVTSGFQEIEMTMPRQMLKNAGAVVHIVSPDDGIVKAWDCDIPKVTKEFVVDVPLSQARAEDYDALLIPGGYGSPEELRLNEQAITFVRGFVKKPIAAICHGPSLLIDAELVRHKKLTSYAAIKKDLMNAGAQWIDKEMVRDGNLITSRMPDDLPVFIKAIIDLFSEYVHKNNRRDCSKKIKYH